MCFLSSCDGGVTNTVGYDDVDDSDWKKLDENRNMDDCVDFSTEYNMSNDLK